MRKTITLKNFKSLIDYLDLSDIQEELQSIHGDTIYNSFELDKGDFNLTFDTSVSYIYKEKSFSSGITIKGVIVSEVELWQENERIELTKMMILALEKHIEKTVKSFI